MEKQISQENTVAKNARTSSFLRWALTIAIMIVLNLVFNYGIYSFYKPAEYDAFCPASITAQNYTEANLCTENGGQWTEYQTKDSPVVAVSTKPIVAQVEPSGYCNATYTCQKNYETSQNFYNRNVFIVLVILGILALVGSFFFMKYESVAYGFASGGVLSLIIGSVRYWSNMQDIMRLVVLVVCLAILIWLGVKKMKE